MVALKRLFHTDKSVGPSFPDAPPNQESVAEAKSQSPIESPLVALNGRESGYREYAPPPSQALDANRHFQDLEKRFEALHDRLEARPSSACSRPVSASSKRAPAAAPGNRHVDLLEALFTSHRYRIRTSMWSPITPFNEDIAERNMTRFLQEQYVNGKAYSRFISAIYQEDVADRNIARSRGSSGTCSRPSTRSSAGTTRFSASSQSSGQSRKKYSSQRSSAPARPSIKRSSTASSENLRARSLSPGGGQFESIHEQSVGQPPRLRPRKSAPDLLAARSEERSTSKEQTQTPTAFLGIPAAHKAGDIYSNTPLPDSPTVPEMMMPRPVSREKKGAWSALESRRCSSLGSRATYKRNIRDLSIDTSLAALTKPGTRISHRAVQPPTPQHVDPKRPLSIAEVMNSPLPIAPAPITSSPLLASSYNATEIMNMFKQAFASTTSMSPHHPTFETLQEAIVREINSHEAFRRVPVPEPGPPFTPVPTQQAPGESSTGPKRPDMVRSLSAKESHFARILKMSPTRRHRRTAESRKSISTSKPSLGYEQLVKQSSGTEPRRRHTDAQPPTASFWKSMQPPPMQQASEESGQDLTYMDLLLRHGQSYPVPKSSRPNSTPAVTRSTISVSSSYPSGTVYRMQAHSSDPASEGSSANSISDGRRDKRKDGENDDGNDIDTNKIPQTRVEPPKVRVQSVDDNNVTYIINDTTPEDAERLINWPQRAVETGKLSASLAPWAAADRDRFTSPDSPTLPRVMKQH